MGDFPRTGIPLGAAHNLKYIRFVFLVHDMHAASERDHISRG
jgi:hypothetical protein